MGRHPPFAQLQALVRAHLALQHVANRWTMHDLVRLYATEMADTDSDDAKRALKSVVEHYSEVVSMAFEWLSAVASEVSRKVFKTPAHAAAWFEMERATAISIVKHIADRDGYELTCLQFGVVLGDLLRSQAHWRADFYDIAAVTASVVERAATQPLAASAVSNYGTSLSMQQKYEAARAALDAAVSMYEWIGDPIVPAGQGETSPTYCKRKAATTTRSPSTDRTSSSVRRTRTRTLPRTP